MTDFDSLQAAVAHHTDEALEVYVSAEPTIGPPPACSS